MTNELKKAALSLGKSISLSKTDFAYSEFEFIIILEVWNMILSSYFSPLTEFSLVLSVSQ